MKKRAWLLGMITSLLLVLPRCNIYQSIPQEDHVSKEAIHNTWFTGPDSLNYEAPISDTEDHMKGTDLGIPFLHDNEVYFLFGDTNTKEASPGRDISNLIGKLDHNSNSRTGIEILGKIVDRNDFDETIHTVIPTGAISLDDKIYVNLMLINEWGQPGKWETSGSIIASSEDDGKTFEWHDYFPEDSNFVQTYFFNNPNDQNYVYLLGLSEGRFGGVKLGRVAPENLDNLESIEYYNHDNWTISEEDASIVVEGPVGELSVKYDSSSEEYQMFYLNETKDDIVMRTSSNLINWGPEQLVLECEDEFAGCYAPMVWPNSNVLNISFWNNYNVRIIELDKIQ